MEIPDCVVLCGGKGERLLPLTRNTQKCLLPVMNRPIIDYVLFKIRELELDRIILCCGYLGEDVVGYLSSLYECSHPDEFINNGSRILKALDLIKTEHIVVMNGDSYCDIDYNHFWYAYKKYLKGGADLCVFLANLKNSLLSSFIPSKISDCYGAGIYFFKKSFLDKIGYNNNISIEMDIVPKAQGMFYELPVEFSVIDIGTHKNYERVNNGRTKFGRIFRDLDKRIAHKAP